LRFEKEAARKARMNNKQASNNRAFCRQTSQDNKRAPHLRLGLLAIKGFLSRFGSDPTNVPPVT
jgi:hypothetical protein